MRPFDAFRIFDLFDRQSLRVEGTHAERNFLKEIGIPKIGVNPGSSWARQTTGTTIPDMAMETQLWRCKADSLALGTTMDPSMGSWDLKRDEQFALTNATTISARTA